MAEHRLAVREKAIPGLQTPVNRLGRSILGDRQASAEKTHC